MIELFEVLCPECGYDKAFHEDTDLRYYCCRCANEFHPKEKKLIKSVPAPGFAIELWGRAEERFFGGDGAGRTAIHTKESVVDASDFFVDAEVAWNNGHYDHS